LARAQTVAAGESEAAKCLDRIAAVERKSSESTRIVSENCSFSFKGRRPGRGSGGRNERRRLKAEHRLTEKHLVNEPRALRTLQQQSVSKIAELTAALVNETVPKLVS
jgi:hypothetical protein